MAIRSCRAEMIGLSERDRTLLRSLLAASQARTGMRWDGDASQPGVYFIDLDGQEGADFWQSLDDFVRRDATIVLSTRSPAEGVRWLPKPLRSAALLSVLETMLLPARQPAAATAAAGAQTAALARVPRVPPAAEPHSLLDYLDGLPATIARTLQSPHWPDIVLASGNTHAMRTATLDNYSEGFIASLEVSRATKYTGGPMDDELRIDLDTLRWLALLYAPIGEIGAHLPYPKRARLRKLPAFGQLPHKLQHVRLAAWLVQHPATPQELAEMIGVDEETVQRFLGACAALGLMEEIADELPEPPPVPAPVSVVEAPVATAAVIEAPAAIEAPTAIEAPESPVAETPPVAETLSVLERLRATREQNRARVAAAITSVSGN
jgi:hypothetical protein